MAQTSSNYYDLLGVLIDSTEKEIIKAYRKKALTCHPDKNPDNPKAADLFIQISEALKVLTDKEARAAFDKVLRAKEAARLRTQAFDAKRKKFKDDLEKREKEAETQRENEEMDAEKLAAQIKRLREEGSRLLKEQQELIKKQIEEEKLQRKNLTVTPKLKVKWKASKTDHDNGGYNNKNLTEMFEKYGEVTAILMSHKKNGLAIIEYADNHHANIALEFEKGLEENPLLITWLEGNREKQQKSTNIEVNKIPSKEADSSSLQNDNDFESIVLMRMRQAEERKRLTEQILKEDKNIKSAESTENPL